jgi:flavorubredoxin
MVASWLADVATALDGRQPDYLIVQHLEPDHSAGIEAALKAFPAMRVVTSPMALKMLPAFCDTALLAGRVITVADGATLNLGGRELTFIAAPMVHWPEVTLTYDPRARVLFSADAFGWFGPVDEADVFNAAGWTDRARPYYYNIVGKYGPQTQSVLKKLAGVEVDTICPLHGPVLRGDLTPYLSLYDTWSRYQPEAEGVFIPYGSIYGSTRRAALALAEMLSDAGVERVEPFDLSRGDVSRAVAEAFRLSTMVVAGVSYDAGLFPAVDNFLARLAMKGYQGRRVGLIENGSWAPSAARVMRERLAKMKGIELVEPVVTLRSRVTEADTLALRALATAIVAPKI